MRPRIDNGGPRVLLVEALDAIGAEAVDVHGRVALLRSAGASVVPLAVAAGLPSGAPQPFVSGAGAEARSALRTKLREDRFDRILLASALPGGGALADLLPDRRDAFWWPTGLSQPRGEGLSGLWVRLTGRPHLPSWWTDVAAGERTGAESASGSEDDTRGARRNALPLWDGDVVVAPEGFRTPAGRTLLEAFSHLAEEWPSVDLVAWTEAPRQGERHARRLGIEARVHHAGAPTRMAEWAWWRHSQALVLSGAQPVSHGLLLRALVSGCPVLWIGEVRRLAPSVARLSQRGCLSVVPPRPRAVAEALARTLGRVDEVEMQVGRARALPLSEGREALREALASWLGTRSPAAVRAA